MNSVVRGPSKHATPHAFFNDVIEGLSQEKKSLSPKWLYDARGSALFEDITKLPEYYITRLEIDLLKTRAQEFAALVPSGGALVEIGSGASVKTRLLLDQASHLGAYVPIDISEAFLSETASFLRQQYPKLKVLPVAADFLSAVEFPDIIKQSAKVGFFPGSTIGNLARHEARLLLSRACEWPAISRFVLGVDLVKDPSDLVAAYDDSQGVTAAFIKNILVRMRDELDAKVDPNGFDYRAVWNAQDAQIEMSLVSARSQTIQIAGRHFEFSEDEELHVSTSRKFTKQTLEELAQSAGWTVETMMSDPQNQVALAVLENPSQEILA